MKVDLTFVDNPKNEVYSGRCLFGVVHLTLNQQSNIRGVFIELSGKEEVYNEKNALFKAPIAGQRVFLSRKTYLTGGTDAELPLVPGSYEYSFETLIPFDVPSSRETEFGSVRYLVKAGVDIPPGPARELKVPFKVIKGVDLGTMPQLKKRVLEGDNPRLPHSCIVECMISAPLTFLCELDHGAYIPGETIKIMGTIDNDSEQAIQRFKATLVKGIKYYPNDRFEHSKSSTTTLAEMLIPGCGNQKEHEFTVEIIVPSTEPTDDSPDNLIRLEYLIEVEAAMDSMLHSDAVVVLPVTIGVFRPIDEKSGQLANTYAPSAPMIPNETFSTNSSHPSASGSTMSKVDPPSYDEALATPEKNEGSIQRSGKSIFRVKKA